MMHQFGMTGKKLAANRANADGLTDTFKNIEREAQRRAAPPPIVTAIE